MSPEHPVDKYDGPPRNIAYIDQLQFDSNLQPVSYEISGTSPSSMTLILDVQILEATGREPYRGDVFIKGTPWLVVNHQSIQKFISFLFLFCSALRVIH